MEKPDMTQLTVSIETVKLQALNYFMGVKGNASVQKELEKRLKELYEEYISEETRGYIESRIKPVPSNKGKGKRTASKPIAKSADDEQGAPAKSQELPDAKNPGEQATSADEKD